MKDRHLILAAIALAIPAIPAIAADAPNFAGEYADKKFLKGQGVFQLSLEQKGNVVSVFFSAAHNDGSGAAPEAEWDGQRHIKRHSRFQMGRQLQECGHGNDYALGQRCNPVDQDHARDRFALSRVLRAEHAA